MSLRKSTVRTEPPATPSCTSRNGIYPLMNFAAARPLGLPRVLAPPPEEAQKAKTPTPEPFDSETRKVSPNSCCTVLSLRIVHNQIMGAFSGDLSLSIPVFLQAARDFVETVIELRHPFSPEAPRFCSLSPILLHAPFQGLWPPPFLICIQSHHPALRPSLFPSIRRAP